MAEDTDPYVGRTIGGCRVEELLGRGAMAVVYKAEQLSLDRVVALKLLEEGSASEEGALPRFFREARSAARLVHPNIVQVYDVGVDQGVPYIIMEYVEGETLYDRLQREGKLDAARALEIVRQASLALVRAREFGIVHRDIKPANIMLSRRGEVKLADFGLAKAITDTTVTRASSRSALGTPYYMSPEQAEGGLLDERSDIYSLGATFYHLLAGRPPFTGESAAAIILAHATEKLVPACEKDESVPRAVSDLVGKMMAKAPVERYPSPRALLAAISGVKSALYQGRGSRPKPRTELNLAVGVADRRSYRRLAADLVADVRPLAAPEDRLDEIRSQVKNLSKRGLFVETDDTAPVGAVVQMKLHLTPHSPEVRALGVVRWTSDAPGTRGMGIQFLDLDEAAASRGGAGTEASTAAGAEGIALPGVARGAVEELTHTPRHLDFLKLHAASQGDALPVGEVARRLEMTRGLVRLILRPFAARGLVRERGDMVEFMVPADEELASAIARRLEDEAEGE